MRLITANYVFLPGSLLMKYGIVCLEDRKVVEVIDTGGKIREQAGLEFYGGLLADGRVKECLTWSAGDPLLECLSGCYNAKGLLQGEGLCLIEQADLTNFLWLPESRIIQLV